MEEKKEGRRGWQYRSLLVASLAFAVGLAGCGHGGNEAQLRDDLITFSDKFFDVAHVSGDVFVIVGYNGRILRTEDGGQSWQEIFADPAKETGETETTTEELTKAAAKQADPAKRPRVTEYSLTQVEFVGEQGWAVGHHGTILHSRDGGKTWTKQQVDSEKTLFSVSFVDALHGRVSGDESTFLSTDNGGETWNVQRIEVSTIGLSAETALAVPDVIYYSVDFVDAQNGWMVGEYGNIRHTADGGKTWDAQHLSLLDELVAKGKAPARDVMLMGAFSRVHFSDLNHGIVVGASGAIAVTDNGGNTWRWISREGDNPEVPSLHLYDFASVGQNGLASAVGANGTVLTSKNEGMNWQPAKINFGVFTWINGLAFADQGKGLLVGGRGIVLLTDDGGQTWNPISGRKGRAG